MEWCHSRHSLCRWRESNQVWEKEKEKAKPRTATKHDVSVAFSSLRRTKQTENDLHPSIAPSEYHHFNMNERNKRARLHTHVHDINDKSRLLRWMIENKNVHMPISFLLLDQTHPITANGRRRWLTWMEKSSWAMSREFVWRRDPLVKTSCVRSSCWRIIDVRCYTITSKGRFRHLNP